MKRISRIVALFLVFAVVLAVPAFAATVTADSMAASLASGWSSSYASGYSTSWFYYVLSNLKSLTADSTALKSGWTSSYATGYSGSWYYRVISLLTDIKTNTAASSSGSTSTTSSNFTTTNSTNLNSIYSYLSSSTSGWTTMMTRLLNLYTNSGLILDELESINGHLVDVYGHDISLNLKLIETHTSFIAGISDKLTQIVDVIASPEDIAINESQSEEKNAWNSGFGSVDRTTSISDFSGFEGGFKDWFSLPDVDITSMFDQVDTGFSSWFSQETADALKAQYGTATLSLDDGESDTPLLDENQRQVQEILSGGDGDWSTH